MNGADLTNLRKGVRNEAERHAAFATEEDFIGVIGDVYYLSGVSFLARS